MEDINISELRKQLISFLKAVRDNSVNSDMETDIHHLVQRMLPLGELALPKDIEGGLQALYWYVSQTPSSPLPEKDYFDRILKKLYVHT